MTISDYIARRDREPELVSYMTIRGARREVLAVEERVLEDERRVMELLESGEARSGFRKADRVTVNERSEILHHADRCGECTRRAGEYHTAWCSRRDGTARTVSADDGGLLKGWSS